MLALPRPPGVSTVEIIGIVPVAGDRQTLRPEVPALTLSQAKQLGWVTLRQQRAYAPTRPAIPNATVNRCWCPMPETRPRSSGCAPCDAAQPTAGELAQELDPERFRLARADRQTENFTTAVAVDADRDCHGDRDDATLFAHLHTRWIPPEIWPIPFDWSLKKGSYALIDLATEPADLAL
jgi:thiol-disulfide isomerase/thioredoxin